LGNVNKFYMGRLRVGGIDRDSGSFGSGRESIGHSQDTASDDEYVRLGFCSC
jgi:hypothetical protein